MACKRRTAAVIVAAGAGTRMGTKESKMFCEILGKPVIAYTIRAFEECDVVNEIILVSREEDIFSFWDIINSEGFEKVKKIVRGGKTRQASVLAGISEAAGFDRIAVHDGARPLVTPEIIRRAVLESDKTGAAVVGVRVCDTIKEAGDNGIVSKTLDRERLWQIQTPQVFDAGILQSAHQNAADEKTDDASLVEQAGGRVLIVEGSYENIKITTSFDLAVAEAVLISREE